VNSTLRNTTIDPWASIKWPILGLIIAVSIAVAVLALQSILIPVGFWLALVACVVLLRIMPSGMEILLFLIPAFAPAIPAFTGLSAHYIVLTIVWTAAFLFYWYFQSLSGAWHRESIRTPYIYPMIVYRIIFTISILSHPLHKNALNYSLQSIALIGIYWLLVQSLQGQNLRRLILAIIWGSILSAAAFLIAFSLGSPKYILFGLLYGVLRPVVMDYSANAWGWCAMVGMPLALAFLVHNLFTRRQLAGILGGLLLLTITALVCNSRSVLLAIGASSIFIMFTHPKARKRLFLAISTLPILFVLVPQTWFFAQNFLRLKVGLTGRVLLWRLASDYITEHPLTGLGPGWFFSKIVVDAPPTPDALHLITGRLSAHNSYLMTATDLGIFALLPVLFIIGLFAWRSTRLWRRLKGGPDFPLLVAISAMMIAGVIRAFFESDFIFLHGYLSDSLLLMVLLAIQDLLYHREFS
jgi:O-antigen ligase